MNKKTNNTSKKEVFIICEGQEDTDYIKKLISLNVWNTKYHDSKSTNFYIFLERFEGDASRWIDEINKALNH